MNADTETLQTASHNDLLSIERKLTKYLVRFGRNPPDERLENGVKAKLVSEFYITSLVSGVTIFQGDLP